MIIAKEQRKKPITSGQLIKFLKQYPPESIIFFQDFNFKSSKKQVVKDLIFREESYPFNDNKQGKSVILINQFLNLK